MPVGGAFIGDQWHNLFYQNTGTGNNYLNLKLVGVESNRDGIGAKVTLRIGKEYNLQRSQRWMWFRINE